jgi:hypothetical protein
MKKEGKARLSEYRTRGRASCPDLAGTEQSLPCSFSPMEGGAQSLGKKSLKAHEHVSKKQLEAVLRSKVSGHWVWEVANIKGMLDVQSLLKLECFSRSLCNPSQASLPTTFLSTLFHGPFLSSSWDCFQLGELFVAYFFVSTVFYHCIFTKAFPSPKLT